MNINPFGDSTLETLIVRLDSGTEPEERRAFLEQLSSLLPHLNWRSHIFIVDDDPIGQIERASEVIGVVSEYLTEQQLSTICVHPFIYMQESGPNDTNQWENLLGLMQWFQQEAYDQQSEVRMLILPIIKPDVVTSTESILSVAEFFRARLAKPSFYFNEESPLDPVTILQKDLRIYVDPSSETSAEDIISQLWINHIFEDILQRVEEGRTELLVPCRKHIIIDERDEAIFECFAQWEKARPIESLEKLGEPLEKTNCPSCISHSCLAMKENLVANAKSEEGRQVSLGLGIALSKDEMHRDALPHARKAYELSISDTDRAVALLHQGLCYLQLAELALADETLKEGASYSTDPGLFSYHRGNVQFARKNYAEAINRFNETLAAESPEVPIEDLYFNLATSYINLEDFNSARSYLDLMEQSSAPVRFHQGVCDLGEGLVEPALEKFREALDLGPAPEDLSRVRFYIGNCLKEMGRYSEAIPELEQAVEADPSDYMNYNLLGFCFYQVKEHEKAIEVFHKAVEINPGSAIDYASIGSNLRELGRFEDAIAMYQMALSLDPALTFARDNVEKLSAILNENSTKNE